MRELEEKNALNENIIKNLNIQGKDENDKEDDFCENSNDDAMSKH